MKVKYFLLFLIPVFLIFLNLKILAFDHDFYDYENKDVNENLLDYLSNKDELRFNYTQKELIHLEDVKNLFNMLNIVLYVLAFIILIVLILNKDDLSKILMISGFLTMLFMLTLTLIDFGFLFTNFHKAAFSNDYWLLDGNTLLIKTYPIEFFAEFSRRLALNIIITSLILAIIGATRYVYTQYKSSAG